MSLENGDRRNKSIYRKLKNSNGILKQFIEKFSKESGSHSETLKLWYVICLVLKKAHRIKRHKNSQKVRKSLGTWRRKMRLLNSRL